MDLAVKANNDGPWISYDDVVAAAMADLVADKVTSICGSAKTDAVDFEMGPPGRSTEHTQRLMRALLAGYDIRPADIQHAIAELSAAGSLRGRNSRVAALQKIVVDKSIVTRFALAKRVADIEVAAYQRYADELAGLNALR